MVWIVGGGEEDVAQEAPPTTQPQKHDPIVPAAIVVGIGKHLEREREGEGRGGEGRGGKREGRGRGGRGGRRGRGKRSHGTGCKQWTWITSRVEQVSLLPSH